MGTKRSRSIKVRKTKKLNRQSKKRRIKLENEKQEGDSSKPKWPMKSRNFKCWTDDVAFDLVRDTLKKRGWRDRGRLCDPNDVNQLIKISQGKHGRLYARCLWWVHEDDARRLKPLSETVGEKHCIATFMGTDAAVTKIAITELLNGTDFYPAAFVLPKERKLLLKIIRQDPNTYWISKPRNDYAGNGCLVYHSGQKMFKDIMKIRKGKEFVVQRYIHNPFLLSNYKFHFRMYTILSGVYPFKCYLYRDGHALFSTKPYTLSKNTLAENFDTFIHLTNWSVNHSKGNEHLAENKPGVGIGCE